MLIGALPDLTETQSGKDLIAIGVQQGKAEGLVEGKAEGKVEGKSEGKRDSLLMILQVRFGGVPETIHESVMAIGSTEHLGELIQQALQIESISEFRLE